MKNIIQIHWTQENNSQVQADNKVFYGINLSIESKMESLLAKNLKFMIIKLFQFRFLYYDTSLYRFQIYQQFPQSLKLLSNQTMLEFIGFEDNKKIGMILLVMAVLCYFFGITFLFKRSFLILSNVLFMFGLYFFVGINGIIKFFTKKGKVKGTIVLCIGFVLLVIGFAFIGAIVQIAGFFFIFRSFLPDFYEYVCKIPFVGKYLKSYRLQNFLDDIAGNQQSRI